MYRGKVPGTDGYSAQNGEKQMMFYSVIRDKPPCKDCSVRHTACHDECRGYAEWKTKLEKLKEERQKYIQMPAIT